jgi:hypothetical protein
MAAYWEEAGRAPADARHIEEQVAVPRGGLLLLTILTLAVIPTFYVIGRGYPAPPCARGRCIR